MLEAIMILAIRDMVDFAGFFLSSLVRVTVLPITEAAMPGGNATFDVRPVLRIAMAQQTWQIFPASQISSLTMIGKTGLI